MHGGWVAQVTAVAKTVLESRQRGKTVEAAEAWAEMDAKKIKVVPRAVAARDCPAPSVCMVTGVSQPLSTPAPTLPTFRLLVLLLTTGRATVWSAVASSRC
eukprot:COSAG02_NODE_3940_length_6009_cov_3.580880_4_plen_101_part_00